MKYATCKRCNTPNLTWAQKASGRWHLVDSSYQEHTCNTEELKAVKCKYCNAEDLHWAEEVNPITQMTKAILTESYGLPHACDERIAHVAAEKQRKRDEYAKIKTHVEAQADNSACPECLGKGGITKNNSVMRHSYFNTCTFCCGWGTFTKIVKRNILANARKQIWPSFSIPSSRRRW